MSCVLFNWPIKCHSLIRLVLFRYCFSNISNCDSSFSVVLFHSAKLVQLVIHFGYATCPAKLSYFIIDFLKNSFRDMWSVFPEGHTSYIIFSLYYSWQQKFNPVIISGTFYRFTHAIWIWYKKKNVERNYIKYKSHLIIDIKLSKPPPTPL